MEYVCFEGALHYTLTAHFILGWKMEEVVLCVEDLGDRHTADNIVQQWTSVIQEWNLQGKVIAITTDGAQDYCSAARRFSENSVWCCCHRLHLISSKLFEQNEVLRKVLAKCKAIVSLWNSSTNFQREMIECSPNKNTIKLASSSAVRWNSNLKMLESVLKNKTTLEVLQERYSLDLPDDSEWELLEEIIAKFSSILITSKILEKTKHPTIQSVFPLVYEIRKKFSDPCETSTVGELGNQLNQLIDHYFCISDDTANTYRNCGLLLAATYLDPRTKSFNFLSEERDRTFYASRTKKFLEEIITKFPVVPLSSTSHGTTHKKLSTEEFLAGIYQSKETSTDLERYSLFPTLGNTEGFCLLDWWSKREAEYPILSRAVKRILSIPASSAASERTFSITKHQTGPKRSSLTKENFSKSSFIACNRHLVKLT